MSRVVKHGLHRHATTDESGSLDKAVNWFNKQAEDQVSDTANFSKGLDFLEQNLDHWELVLYPAEIFRP